MVAYDLRPRVSADREHFGALHDAGVDEDDFSRRGFAKAEAFVDEPLVDDELHDFWSCSLDLPKNQLCAQHRLLHPFLSSSCLLAAISVLLSAHLSVRTRTPSNSLI